MTMRLRAERPLYIIAPTLWETALAAREWGLDPKTASGVRAVCSAYALRGTRPGTAFITWNRASWPATRQGYELDEMVAVMQRTGRLRPAGDDDIATARGDPPAALRQAAR